MPERILIVGALGGLEIEVVALLAGAGHDVVLVNDHTVFQIPASRAKPDGTDLVVLGQERSPNLCEAMKAMVLALPKPPVVRWKDSSEAQWKQEFKRWGKRR